MFRPWRNFPFMVAAGLVLGLLVGGFPEAYSTGIQQASLILAMAFSLTEISFRGISAKEELRGIALAAAMSYLILGGLVVVFAAFSSDPEIRAGWVLVAAVPPAVGVVPVTSFLRGDVRRSLISDAVLYLLGLVTVPALSLLFLGQTVPVDRLVVQTLLLIGLPIVLSRPLRAWPRIEDARPTAVSLSFFVLVFAIAGSTRGALVERPDLLAGLSTLGLVRTFGLGLLLFGVTQAFRLQRNARIMVMAFAGFKNLGLTVVLAFTFFGPLASLPSIVSLICEILWMGSLPFLFRIPTRGVSEIPP